LDLGTPITYQGGAKAVCRSAFGAALLDVAEKNYSREGATPIAVFDCDLAPSVKTAAFAKKFPSRFFQFGIQEHCTATAAGAASVAGVVAVWADFGVFGADEVYNQQRLNDINRARLKTVLTHVGLDVGEDGATHQCEDYLGLLRNAFGYRVVVPADPNQADRAARWMLTEPSNVCLAMGRGSSPVILKDDGSPFFGGDYEFEYGAIDVLRDGSDVTLLAMGQMTSRALAAADILAKKGIGARVLNASSPLGMDAERLISLTSGLPLVTCEDHNADTGLGAAAALHFARNGAAVRMRTLGATRYGDSGPSSEVMARMGLSPEGVASAAESLL
jgi:transketolase